MLEATNMTTISNTKGVSHASCKGKSDTCACGGCCRKPLIVPAGIARDMLLEAGMPRAVVETCAWLSEPMFRHEYPDLDVNYIITEPTDMWETQSLRRMGIQPDIWIGVGYESAHSEAACKMHFDFDSDTGTITWCNVSEWAVDDDRWRGARLFYDGKSPLSLCRLYQEIEEFFAS